MTPSNDNAKKFDDPARLSFQAERVDKGRIVEQARKKDMKLSDWLREAALEKLSREKDLNR